MPIPEPSPTLVKAIRERQAIAIVGSGLSIQAGAPSWSQLLMGTTEECRRTHPEKEREIADILAAVERGEYLDAAGVLQRILGPDFHDAIKRQIPRDLAPTACHEILVRLGFRGIITLNYDLLLERAASRQHIDLPTYSSSEHRNFAANLRWTETFLMKLHGDIDHPEDLVLARSEYQRLRKDSPVLHSVARFLGPPYVLFWVGYGHRDPTLEELRLDELIPGLGTGFSVAVERNPTFEARMDDLQVSMSWLEDYDQMASYLELLQGVDPPPRFAQRPKRLHLVYACEDRSFARELVQDCRTRGIDIRWDQDWPPWDDRRREKVPVDESDVLVVYGSVAQYPLPFVREACERAVALGRPIVLLLEPKIEAAAVGSAVAVVRVDREHGPRPADALIEHLRPEPVLRHRPALEDEVWRLLDEALKANEGIPTDTLTDRIFLTEKAAELTIRAHEVARDADDLDENQCFRADLEYARLLRFRGQWGNASDHLKNLLERAADAQNLDGDLHHLILLEQGALEFERGHVNDGISKVKQVLSHFESQAQVGPNLIKALRQLGNMSVEQGDWKRAEELLSSAVHLAHYSRMRRGAPDRAATLLWLDCRRELGSFLVRNERVAESLKYFHDALQEAEGANHPSGHHLAGVLCYHIGRTNYLHTGDLREAERYLQKGIDILERYDNPVRIAFLYEHLARVGTKLPPSGNEEWIYAYFMRALQIRERTGHTYMAAKTRIGLGDFHHSRGDFPLAIEEYEKARAICRDHGKRPELARSSHSLGRAYVHQGNRHQAKKYLRQAERLFRDLGLTKPLREVEFELLKLEEPRLLDSSFDELIAKGRAKDYEFCINEVGEYAVHSFIRKLTASKPLRTVEWRENLVEVDIGIGDDAAVFHVPHADQLDVVLTTDAAPGSLARSPAIEKGRYAAKFSVVHTLSDLLAMGATPIGILLNLYLKRDAKLEYVMRVVETVHQEAQRYGAALIGGDLKERPEQSIGCVGIGLVPRKRALRRSGARAGHIVAITLAAMDGTGAPRGIGKRWAQEVLESRQLTEEPAFRAFCQANWKEKLLFLPYREMLNAAKTGKVRSAIDTSDGVLACLQLLGKESKVSFLLDEELVENLVDPEVREVARHLGLPPAQFLFNAGHDWEIVLTVDNEDFLEVRAAVRGTGGDLAPLGKVIAQAEALDGGVAYRRKGGKAVYLPFFTDEKFVRRPYEERPFEWEDLKAYLEGGQPLPDGIRLD